MRTAPRRYICALLAIVLGVLSLAGGGAESGHEILPFRKINDGAKGIEDLRARDLSLPELGPDDICPVIPSPEPLFGGVGSGVRAGPVGAVGIGVNSVLHFDSKTVDDWYSSKILWVLDADLPPLLVRGRRLDGPGKVAFRRSGAESASSLVLDEDVQSTIGPEYRDQPSGPRVRESGCYALQIDGPDFQSVIVFRAVASDFDEPSTRTFGMRPLRLDAGEGVAFAVHQTNGIRVSSKSAGLEVCPAELSELYNGGQLASTYWFKECRPVIPDDPLDLPDAVVDHVAFLVRNTTSESLTVDDLVVTYEPGDEFFFFVPPPLDPGEQSAAVVTPTSWDVVVVDPSGRSVSAMVLQYGQKIGDVELPDVGREGTARGPVIVGDPVVVRVRNPGTKQQAVGVAVYWS